MPYDVFISYQHDDLTISKEVCDILEAANISCWMSARDERPGENWMAAIVRGLDESKIVVFILSINSDRSLACKKELALAHERKMPILPLRVEDITPTADMQYLLAQLHRLDALSRPLDQHLKVLVEAVQNLITPHTGGDSHVQSIKETLDGSKQHLDDLESFRANRLGKLYKRRGPPLLNGTYPKLVLHVVPRSAFEEWHVKIALGSLENDTRFEPLYTGSSGRPIYGRDSIMKYFMLPNLKAVESSVEIFQKGTIEAIKLIFVTSRDPEEKSIDPLYEEDIKKQLPQYVSLLEQHSISPPIYIALSFLDVRDWYMWVEPMKMGYLQRVQYHIPLIEDQILTDWEVLDNFEDVRTPDQAARFMKPVFDVLWREAGLQGSLNYDKEGNWKG